MVPTGQTTPYHRFNGSLPVGGNASSPTYLDVEAKASAECAEERYKTTMRDPLSGDVVSITSTRFPFLQIWTGPKPTFGVDALVLEPLSAMSDGFNNHDNLHIINPGQTFQAEIQVSVD